MLAKFYQRTHRRNGAVIIILSFFMLFVLLPMVAVAYDLGQYYLYKQHLTNLVQLGTLSCMPGAGNKFSNDCVSTAAAVVLINLKLGESQYVDGGLWQPKNQRNRPGRIPVKRELLTGLFRMTGTTADQHNKKANFVLDIPSAIRNINPASMPMDRPGQPPVPVEAARQFFHVTNNGGYQSDALYLSGTYYPTFLSIFPEGLKEVKVRSAPVHVEAKTVN